MVQTNLMIVRAFITQMSMDELKKINIKYKAIELTNT